MAVAMVKTVSGIDILMDSDTGQFSAQIGGAKVSRNTLAAVEREIMKRSLGLTAIIITGMNWGSWPTYFVDEVVGERGGKWRCKEHGLVDGVVIPFDQRVVDEIERLRDLQRNVADQGYRLNDELHKRSDIVKHGALGEAVAAQQTRGGVAP